LIIIIITIITCITISYQVGILLTRHRTLQVVDWEDRMKLWRVSWIQRISRCGQQTKLGPLA